MSSSHNPSPSGGGGGRMSREANQGYSDERFMEFVEKLKEYKVDHGQTCPAKKGGVLVAFNSMREAKRGSRLRADREQRSSIV